MILHFYLPLNSVCVENKPKKNSSRTCIISWWTVIFEHATNLCYCSAKNGIKWNKFKWEKKNCVEIIQSLRTILNILYFICCVLHPFTTVDTWRSRSIFLMNEVWIEWKNDRWIYQIMHEIICRTKSNFIVTMLSSKNDEFMFLFTLLHVWRSKIKFRSDGFQTHWKYIMKTMGETMQIEHIHVHLLLF